MFCVLVFMTIFIKCLFNGYEYMTTTLVMMVVPVVYYGILKGLSFRGFLTSLSMAAFSSILAILLSFLILCLQIASVEGSFLDGINHIVHAFARRTLADPSQSQEILVSDLEFNTIQVVATYLKGTFFDAGNYLSGATPFISKYLLKVSYLHLILLFMLMSGILYFLRNKHPHDKRKHLALIVATWFSILAPLSWFIIFKEHSYIHRHMNFIVWQMPFVFFGFAVCGLVVKSLLPDSIHLARRFHFASIPYDR